MNGRRDQMCARAFEASHTAVFLRRLAFVGLLPIAFGFAFQSAPARPDVQPRAPFTAEELLADVQTLVSAEFEGRRTGSPGNAKTRGWVLDRFREAGLAPLAGNFQMPFRFTRNTVSMEGVNIAGLCRGSSVSDRRAIVITAHYDHLGVRGGVMYPGADDNASGVAVLLALARRCRQTPWTHDVVFVAIDAEEQGLQGARAFVAAPPIPKERIALNVNLDMVSRSDKRELWVAGTYHWPELKPVLDPVAARAPITVRFGHDRPKDLAGGVQDWTMQSDHGPFHAAGIPFVYFGVEDHGDYHKPTDIPGKINAVFFVQAATTILDAVTAIDRLLPAPRP